MYARGTGVPEPNEGEAKRWFELATKNGNEWAPLNLSKRFLLPNATEDEVQQGLDLLDLSIERGLAQAYVNKAIIFLEGDLVPKNEGQAFHLFARAAGKANTNGHYNIARMFENGLYVARDIDKAVTQYKLAADLGSVRSMNDLGWLYQHDDELGIDYAAALFWYEKAADEAYALAQENLGNTYRLGELGLEADPIRARFWLEKAASQSRPKAMRLLGIESIDLMAAAILTDKFGQRDFLAASEYLGSLIDSGHISRSDANVLLESSAKDLDLRIQNPLIRVTESYVFDNASRPMVTRGLYGQACLGWPELCLEQGRCGLGA